LIFQIYFQASKYGQSGGGSSSSLVLTDEEKSMSQAIRQVWSEILKVDVQDDTDFFAYGAGSMDVVRLILNFQNS
jgi:formyltetrahydrofolate dehydrogenase